MKKEKTMTKLQTWNPVDNGFDTGMVKPINNDGEYYDKDDVDLLLKELEELRERVKSMNNTGLSDNFQIFENPINKSNEHILNGLSIVYSCEDNDYYLIDWVNNRYTWYEHGTFFNNRPQSDFGANSYFEKI